MSNIVQFPSAGAAIGRASAHLGSRLLSDPPAHTHAVQFYDDEPFLLETVAFFLSAGLAAGDAVLLVATPAHTDGISSQIPSDLRASALARGRLMLVDAEAMLARFMRDDVPVEALFDAAIDHIFESGFAAARRSTVGAARGPMRVRAFGEMVDLLWKRGNTVAALRLEELWNRASARHELTLLCGYGMRNFYRADDAASFDQVCRLHTHVMPTERFAKDAGDVFDRLRDISVLEQRARSLECEVAYREELEGTLRAAFGERSAPCTPAGDRRAEATSAGRLPSGPSSALPGLLQTLLAAPRRLALPEARATRATSRVRRLLGRAIDAARSRLLLRKTGP